MAASPETTAVLDMAIADAISKLTAADVRQNGDGQYELEIPLTVRVTFDASDAVLFDEKMLKAEAMGAACCKCVKYQNGSWWCAGTCC